MPELPEVETIVRSLAKAISGATLTKLEVYSPKLRYEIPSKLKSLEGLKLNKIFRRSKYILFEFLASTKSNQQDNLLLAVHLGMSGRLLLFEDDFFKTKHDHLFLSFDNGFKLRLNDPRRFGIVDLLKASELDTHKLFRDLGPEPFSEEFSAKYLHKRNRKKSKAVKLFIMDPGVVVGVGNIYASEALFEAGIKPQRAASTLTLKDCTKLREAILYVLDKAIKAGGSTLRDYLQADGKQGYFQHEFKVYGREGEPCSRCKTPIKRLVQGQRSSFYCAGCQV